MMKALDWVAWVSFIMGLSALPFLVVNWFSYIVKRARARRSPSVPYKFPVKSVLFFSIPVLTVLCVGFLSKSIGHAEVMHAIHSLNNDARVLINGKPAENSGEILLVLKTLHWIFPHHSDPTRRIDIQIYDHSRHITLVLARDSGNPREYWVFYPKYYITTTNEIGRVVTTVFDAY